MVCTDRLPIGNPSVQRLPILPRHPDTETLPIGTFSVRNPPVGCTDGLPIGRLSVQDVGEPVWKLLGFRGSCLPQTVGLRPPRPTYPHGVASGTPTRPSPAAGRTSPRGTRPSRSGMEGCGSSGRRRCPSSPWERRSRKEWRGRGPGRRGCPGSVTAVEPRHFSRERGEARAMCGADSTSRPARRDFMVHAPLPEPFGRITSEGQDAVRDRLRRVRPGMPPTMCAKPSTSLFGLPPQRSGRTVARSWFPSRHRPIACLSSLLQFHARTRPP